MGNNADTTKPTASFVVCSDAVPVRWASAASGSPSPSSRQLLRLSDCSPLMLRRAYRPAPETDCNCKDISRSYIQSLAKLRTPAEKSSLHPYTTVGQYTSYVRV